MIFRLEMIVCVTCWLGIVLCLQCLSLDFAYQEVWILDPNEAHICDQHMLEINLLTVLLNPLHVSSFLAFLKFLEHSKVVGILVEWIYHQWLLFNLTINMSIVLGNCLQRWQNLYSQPCDRLGVVEMVCFLWNFIQNSVCSSVSQIAKGAVISSREFWID